MSPVVAPPPGCFVGPVVPCRCPDHQDSSSQVILRDNEWLVIGSDSVAGTPDLPLGFVKVKIRQPPRWKDWVSLFILLYADDEVPTIEIEDIVGEC